MEGRSYGCKAVAGSPEPGAIPKTGERPVQSASIPRSHSPDQALSPTTDQTHRGGNSRGETFAGGCAVRHRARTWFRKLAEVREAHSITRSKQFRGVERVLECASRTSANFRNHVREAHSRT